MLSYLVLSILAVVAGFFIYTEITTYLSSETAEENDTKLLKTGSFLTQLYEAESLSKMALQTKTRKNFNAYSQKIDSVFIAIDSLKLLTQNGSQKSLLDSVQQLLQQKVANSNELLRLKVENDATSSIDTALEEFKKMEASFGKLTIENFEKNPEHLSPYEYKVLEDWVAYLNANIPSEPADIPDSKRIDSILTTSMAVLAEAKKNDIKAQRSLARKEIEINRNDLMLSQQLRTIISTFEQEVLTNSYNDTLKKKAALKRGIRLAGFTALLGFLIVALFTFLINRDFWRVQTYRQKLEEEKKYSESLLKSREQLIATVSHDLRTPLNTITGYAELIENTTLDQKQKRYLQQVKSASRYVVKLVTDLLDFSKLEGGKMHIEKVPFILSELVKDTSKNIQALYTNKKLRLHLDISEKLEQTVLGDPFRIRQILSNLIGNAYKFTEEGCITINGTVQQKVEKEIIANIEVTDTGIGIPKEKQGLIFKEFTQADALTEKKYGGYGLGLTISKKLTTLLNGSLLLKSKAGQGSTFTLQLPLQTTSVQLDSKTTITDLKTRPGILIIDDDTALLKMLGELAESIEVTAYTFSNFYEIKKETPLHYDVVLTDIQMPKISGFEVLDKLQSEGYHHYNNQAVVAMTGRRDLDSYTYTSNGFAQVLQKPFTKKELGDVLYRLGITAKKTSGLESSIKKNKKEVHSYSLDAIHSFLGENEEAIYDVLQTFLRDTHSNVQELEKATRARDYAQVNYIAHRMLPMFRQLKVKNAIAILEKLELANTNAKKMVPLQDCFHELKIQVDVLMAELKKRLATSPSYND